MICDRAFAQVKTFSDKGAERKAREEEKRFAKLSASEAFTFSCLVRQKSIFQRAFDMESEAILYSPKNRSDLDQKVKAENGTEKSASNGINHPTPVPVSRSKKPSVGPSSRSRCPSHGSSAVGNLFWARTNRVLVYARQENESIYTPLHIYPPTVQGMIRAVSEKYQIETVDIRFVFRQTLKGIIVRVSIQYNSKIWNHSVTLVLFQMDDDMIRFYCNGDVFIMKVMATEDVTSGQIIYDVVFSETEYNKPPPGSPSPEKKFNPDLDQIKSEENSKAPNSDVP